MNAWIGSAVVAALYCRCAGWCWSAAAVAIGAVVTVVAVLVVAGIEHADVLARGATWWRPGVRRSVVLVGRRNATGPRGADLGLILRLLCRTGDMATRRGLAGWRAGCGACTVVVVDVVVLAWVGFVLVGDTTRQAAIVTTAPGVHILNEPAENSPIAEYRAVSMTQELE